jgi:hypothetical protein
MPAPQPFSFFAQAVLINLTDLLENLAHTIQIGDLPAHLNQLIGMESNLTGLSARIVHVQDPLAMAFAASAGGAGDARGMKGVTFEQGAT